MSKLLCLYEREIPTISLMRESFGHLFADTEIDCSFCSLREVTADKINGADSLILIRPHNILSSIIAKKAHESGRLVIFFCDDDLFILPKELPSIPWRIKALGRALRASDIVLSSSQYICEKYCAATNLKRYAVINTVVAENEINNIPQKETYSDNQQVKIVYAAGANHSTLFNKYILPIMPKLCDRYGERISFSFVGVRPDVFQFESKTHIEYHDSMPLLQYREFMREQNYDIGLAPLNVDDFSKCKYFNKYLEYTLVGAVGVYTNCEPYIYVIENKNNGFLVDNTEEDWYEALCTAIDENETRMNCLKAAEKQLKEEFNVVAIRDKLIAEIPELEYKRINKRKCESFKFARLRYKLSRIADAAYLFCFYLKRQGLYKVINRIKTHIKESKIYS